ncbi:MAG: family 20 glycosylhydrolase [Actinomycetaceae bacterium]|nr:family 20 glycosylhydrolase [Actinomycetaceae bacterium]
MTWFGLPQPTTCDFTEGAWKPRNLIALHFDNYPGYAREAERLCTDLDTLGYRTQTYSDADAYSEGEGALSRIYLRYRPPNIRIQLGSDALEMPKNCAPQTMITPTPGTKLSVESEAKESLPWQLRESFEICVDEDALEIRAASAEGIFRGCCQILQNLQAKGSVPRGIAQFVPAVRERGWHLDAARKYFSAAWIKQEIIAGARLGLNYFQWHFSENEGFRIESPTGYHSRQHLTRAEVRDILRVAADYYVTVVPSLDMPGHMGSVLENFPQYRLAHSGARGKVAAKLEAGALNICDETARNFAFGLVADFMEMFPPGPWHLGGDEFVDFTQMDRYPELAEYARSRFGEGASPFDALTDFVNQIASHLLEHGYEPRVWNDGMLRGSLPLSPRVAIAWWTNWHPQMAPLQRALDGGYQVVNFHDSLLYYVLGEKAGYRYPTAEKLWEADWHPGLFPKGANITPTFEPTPIAGRAPATDYANITGRADITGHSVFATPPVLEDSSGSAVLTQNEVATVRAYPPQLRGAYFSIWCDEDAQSSSEISRGIRRFRAAFAERAYRGGSNLSITEFDQMLLE